jgi:hypothetical protein
MAVFSVRRSSARSPRLSVALRTEIPASKIPEIRRAGRGFEVKPGSRLRQLGLVKRSAHRPENFLKSQQSCHLMRQPCLPKRGETRFLSTDCGLQPLARLAPEFQFLADRGDQVPEFHPFIRCQMPEVLLKGMSSEKHFSLPERQKYFPASSPHATVPTLLL